MGGVTRNVRTYDHFCLTARALERVGDRWSLLVIRDLLTGAKRFTDLMDRLGGITPKTLSQRLRELEDAGILTADREPGRREVWYRLTPAGADLGPVLGALGRWGLQHAWRRPGTASRCTPSICSAPLPRPSTSPRATTSLPAGTSGSTVRTTWSKATATSGRSPRGHPPARADVTITASTQALTALIFRGSDTGVDITGETEPVQRFRRLIGTMATVVQPA